MAQQFRPAFSSSVAAPRIVRILGLARQTRNARLLKTSLYRKPCFARWRARSEAEKMQGWPWAPLMLTIRAGPRELRGCMWPQEARGPEV